MNRKLETPNKLQEIEGKLDILLSMFGPTTEEEVVEVQPIQVIKQFNPEELKVIEPLYIAGGSVDAHGDAYKDPVEGPQKLVKAIKEGLAAKTIQSSLFHDHKTKGFEIADVWVNENEAVLEDGTAIPANLPLGLIKFNNEALYNMRVEGRIGGLSMGAKGLVEVVGEDTYDNFLYSLDSSVTPLRVISDFIFTHKAAHYAYTSWDQGGAASKLNEPIAIMKSNNKLSKKEQAILAEIGEEYAELDKKKSSSNVETAPSTSESLEALDAGVDNQTVNKGHTMSVQESPEYKALEKKFLALEIKEDLLPFSLEKAVASDVASALAELSGEQRSVIVKAFAVVKADAEAKAAELQETLTKATAASTSIAPMAELLKGEQGEGAVSTPAPKQLSSTQAAVEMFNKKQSK